MKMKTAASLAVALHLALSAFLPRVGAPPTPPKAKGGSLTVAGNPVTFAPVTLDGTNLTVTATPTKAWSVTDTRGTGAPWTATISATDLTSAAGRIETTPRTLLAGNLAVTTGGVTAGNGADPPTNISGASNLTLSTTSQTLISSTGTSNGTYTFTPTFSLIIPANAYRSNHQGRVPNSPLNPYISTMTLSIS